MLSQVNSMTVIPYDTSVEAEFEDGHVHSESAHNDVSPYAIDKNVFYDILNGLPEADHGAMTRFSVFWQNKRYDVDWKTLPDNARPIRFRHGYSTITDGEVVESGFSGVDFGCQYTDDTGKNQQEVIELR